MNERLIALRDKIDAMTVRERVMMFSAAVGVMVFVMMSLVLSPLYARERTLQAQIAQQRNMIGGIDAEITAVVESYATDPDAPARARLVAIQGETAAMAQAMRANETGLIAPQQIAPLLETILKSNGHLRLVGLTTLPVRPVNESMEAAPAVAASAQTKPPPGDQTLASVLKPQEQAAAKAAGAPEAVPLLYRHGVELTVRGNYLDMVNYMDALESMPARLIWGKANLVVEEYPNSRLTLTMYTLSLDKKWMRL